jgi:hypothetical protein
MDSIKIFVEEGRKKTFAGVIDWPGWCRWGRDEPSALDALVDYGPRYAQVFIKTDLEVPILGDPPSFIVTERVEGDATTSFGAPAIILDIDRKPVNLNEVERWRKMLSSSWQAFDQAVEKAEGVELRVGPRGGGRDIQKIMRHILDGDRGYLRRLTWKPAKGAGMDLTADIKQTREEILNALTTAVKDGLPERGPKGGIIWPVSFFVRRVIWHVLDHTWEIEDRIL